MKLLEGYKLVSLTDTEIVQERILPTGQKITLVGNPNPDPEETKKAIDDLSAFLISCEQRIEAEKRLKRA